MITHGQSIKWDGGSVSVSGCKSSRDARRIALRMAIKSGWRPPRWWECWRWNEHRVDLDFSKIDEHPIEDRRQPQSIET